MSQTHALDRADTVIRSFIRAGLSAAGEDQHALVALLQNALPAHFSFEEESGGFFERLRASGGGAMADRLLAEHHEFRGKLVQLEQAVARGDADVTEKLSALAKHLRRHERAEAFAASRLGTPLPSDGEREPPAGLSPELEAALEQLANDVLDRARRSPEKLLTALCVGIPSEALRYACVEFLDQELDNRGLDFIDIDVVVAEGSPQLVAVTFEPGWAE